MAYTQSDYERDQEIDSRAKLEYGLACARGEGFTWHQSAEVKAARERMAVYRIDRAAEAARATLDSGNPRTAVSSNSEIDDVCRQILAVMLSNHQTKQLERVAEDLKRGRRGRCPRQRMDADDAKPDPTYRCAGCDATISPDDKAYCAPCAGEEDSGGPRANARDCSKCGKAVGAKVYCAQCGSTSDADEKQQQARAPQNRARARAAATLADYPALAYGANPGACSDERTARAAVAAVACPTCTNTKAGRPCRVEDGALVARGACLHRMRAFVESMTPGRTVRKTDDDYYASFSVG